MMLKDVRIALVIDNLQSSTYNTGVTMANQIGAEQVTLSNLPGRFDGTGTWEKAIEQDVNLMLEALANYQVNKP